MSEFIDQDDPKMEALNLREERVKESEDSTQVVSVAPASCSAITEASNKTDASSSRNRDGCETGETTMADKEDDDRNDGDDPKMEDMNLQEGSNPELYDDGAAQESQVENSEANMKTDSSPSSRNGESSETAETTMVAEEDDRSDGDDEEYESKSDEETSSLVTQPPEEIVGLGTQRHRSVYENVGFSSLVTQPSHQNPRVDQIARSGQAMNPHQQHTRPYRGSALHASYQNNFRQPLGMQQHPMANQFPNVVPMQTQMFNPGLAPAPWGPQNTYHQHPMANQISNVVPMQTQMFNPGLAPAPWGPQNTYHQHPMANQFPNVFPMQTQMLNPGLAPAPWGPHNTYQQHPMAYQFPNVAPMQPQMFNPGLAPAPWGPHNTYQQHPMAYQFPNVVPMQTQMFNRGPAPEIWRVQITYQQDSMGIQKFMPWHVFKQLDCPLSMGPIMSPVLAARDSGYVIEQRLISRGMRPRQDPVMHPYQHPEANQQNLRLGQFRSEDVFTTMKPDGQRRTFVIVRNPLNPQQRNFVYIDAVYVRAPLAEVHRMVQLHNQAQQPTLSEEVDGPASSEQGGDQQQSQEVDGPASSEQGGDQVDGAASSERDQQQSQEVDDPASSEQGGDQQKQPR